MPAPSLRFTKDMNPHQLSLSLLEMKSWCQSERVDKEQAKVTVLLKLIDYAMKKNLAATSYFSFMSSGKANESDYQLCDAIFRRANLPELLFLQHVINQIDLIPPGPHPIRDELLTKIQENKDILMIPEIREIRAIGIAIATFSLFQQYTLGIILGALVSCCSKKLAEWHIVKELENKLTLKEMNGNTMHMEDAYHGIVSSLFKFANANLPPVQVENKEKNKPSLT